jgi:F-type H+-transporting ATPase subunit epsilon
MSTEFFYVKILSSNGSIFRGEATSITLPSISGEMSILPNHIPIIAALANGKIAVKLFESSEVKEFDVSEGFLRFTNNECTISIANSEERKKAE